jgi:predicted transposase YdaD
LRKHESTKTWNVKPFLKAAARLLSMGYSILEVASAVDLSVEEITKEVVNSQTHTEQDRTE